MRKSLFVQVDEEQLCPPALRKHAPDKKGGRYNGEKSPHDGRVARALTECLSG
jgi:hypothetical protein